MAERQLSQPRMKYEMPPTSVNTPPLRNLENKFGDNKKSDEPSFSLLGLTTSTNADVTGTGSTSAVQQWSNPEKLPNALAVKKTQNLFKKKRRRFRPGTRALMEIRKFQKTSRPLIPRAPFTRLCKEVIQEMAPNGDHRIQAEAISALQEASEAFLVTFFEAANRCAIHARRVTVMPADFSLVRWILNAFGINWL